jgi:hypothetical protein
MDDLISLLWYIVYSKVIVKKLRLNVPTTL